MIIYNVTVNIDNSVRAEWLKWMQETHIPDVMATGMFVENKILRLIGDEDTGGTTYAIQYTATLMSDYERYRDEFAPALQKHALELFGDKFTAFRTLLETV
ncbi:MAG: DUF4286 family protein [Bacteroidota bacterium]|jgi:hypothetical protein